ncbi:ATP-dependent Clp protease proteolytic subunit [candidate division KSB1 bacterium]|nr:ATP-dependent Clp protease proteolytic subunit [candidate division KSB1 bacterium]
MKLKFLKVNRSQLLRWLILGIWAIWFLMPQSGRAAADSLVYVVEIKGVIEKGLAGIVERMISQAEAAGARAIIFEVNTPGGAVDAAGEIRDAIFNSKLPTYAYVNREAISAGALISLACEKVIMVPGSTMGAVTPVDLAGKKASEKVVSYMRGVMRAIAEKRGRDPKIAEAMVDENLEIPGYTKKGQLLTLTAEEALKLKYADQILEGFPKVLEYIGLPQAQIVNPHATWSENLVRFLTHPVISSLLLTIGMLGLIYEITTQGWGLSGTLAIIALGLFFGAHYLANLANVLEILLFVAGLSLLIVEIFVTPGFGIFGIAGIIAIVLGIVLSLVGNIPTLKGPDIFRALQTLVLTVVFTVGLTIPLVKFLPKTKTWNRMILATEAKKAEGYRATPSENESLLGKEGVALTPLRPAGMAVFDTQRVDVTADGEFIERNTRVKITLVEGNRIVVRRA